MARKSACACEVAQSTARSDARFNTNLISKMIPKDARKRCQIKRSLLEQCRTANRVSRIWQEISCSSSVEQRIERSRYGKKDLLVEGTFFRAE